MCRDAKRLFLLALCALSDSGCAQQSDLLPSTLLGGIGNVASSATNFFVNAVEKPRNLLINATRATTGYSKYQSAKSFMLKLALIPKRTVDSAASKGLEFKLRRFLEKFRTRMRYGIPELRIPPLEPFTLEELHLQTDNPDIGNVNLLVENLVVKYLSTFSIDRAKLSLIGPTISVNISIPEVYATGHYNISGMLGDKFSIHGAGPFEMSIYGFRGYVNVVLGYFRGMYIKSLDLDFSLSSIDANLENFMDDEQIARIMNQVFQDLTPQALKIIKPEILPGIREYLASRANDTIRHLTMRDLLSILLGENEIRNFAHMLIP